MKMSMPLEIANERTHATAFIRTSAFVSASKSIIVSMVAQTRVNFFFNFWRASVLFVGPLMPLFWTFGDICPGFQSQGGSPHLHVLFACTQQNTRIDLWCNILLTPWQPSHSHPQTYKQALVGLKTGIYRACCCLTV